MIVKLYEIERLSAEEIAEAQDLDLEAVKSVLFANSLEYRKAAKSDDKLFTEDDLMAAKMAMIQLMTAEESFVRYRASKFVIDEVKGRNDAKANLAKDLQKFSVSVITEQMAKAREALERGRKAKLLQAIDVESS